MQYKLVRFQQYELALPRAKLATQLAPNNFRGWFILGSLYVQQQKVDEGIRILRRARALAPDEAGILFTLGSAYFQKGDYSTSVNVLEKGLKLVKEDAPEALFDLGNAYFKLQDYSKAIATYEKSFDQEKNFWPAINNIGLVQYEKGDSQGAIENWQRAIAIDEKAAEPQLAVAVALFAQGQQESGLALGEKALAIDSRYADLDFLKENLWGESLIKDTETFLRTPQMQAVLARLGEPSLELELTPE